MYLGGFIRMETENFNITALDIKILEKKVNDVLKKWIIIFLKWVKQIVYKYLLKM